LGLWSCGKNTWEHRNKEIHDHSIQEARSKKGGKLKKEIIYFIREFQENPFLVLQKHQHLFDTEVERLTASTPDMQSAWLRSVKDAIQACKHHDDTNIEAQEARFRQCFIPKEKATLQSDPSPDLPTTRTLHMRIRQ
jgi:hypothetical protein